MRCDTLSVHTRRRQRQSGMERAMGGGSTIRQSHVSTFVCNTQIRFDFQWLPPARATYSGGEKNAGDDCIIIVYAQRKV